MVFHIRARCRAEVPCCRRDADGCLELRERGLRSCAEGSGLISCRTCAACSDREAMHVQVLLERKNVASGRADSEVATECSSRYGSGRSRRGSDRRGRNRRRRSAAERRDSGARYRAKISSCWDDAISCLVGRERCYRLRAEVSGSARRYREALRNQELLQCRDISAGRADGEVASERWNRAGCCGRRIPYRRYRNRTVRIHGYDYRSPCSRSRRYALSWRVMRLARLRACSERGICRSCRIGSRICRHGLEMVRRS